MEVEILNSRVKISTTEVKNSTSWVKISRPLVKCFVKKTLGRVKKTHDLLLGVKRLAMEAEILRHKVKISTPGLPNKVAMLKSRKQRYFLYYFLKEY